MSEFSEPPPNPPTSLESSRAPASTATGPAIEPSRCGAPSLDQASQDASGPGSAASPSTPGDVLRSTAASLSPETPRGPFGRVWIRRVVSACLLYHVVAVVVAPASVAPSSPLMQTCWQGFRHYLQFLYLNHGYHFFAPEPSSSTLVGYTLDYADGRSETGRFPNRSIRPRLMYHRHFMLTEFLGFVPDEEEQPWHRSYARHLGKAAGAERVSLSRITHYLPTQDAVRAGATLNESESFTEVPLGSFRCDEL